MPLIQWNEDEQRLMAAAAVVLAFLIDECGINSSTVNDAMAACADEVRDENRMTWVVGKAIEQAERPLKLERGEG